MYSIYFYHKEFSSLQNVIRLANQVPNYLWSSCFGRSSSWPAKDHHFATNVAFGWKLIARMKKNKRMSMLNVVMSNKKLRTTPVAVSLSLLFGGFGAAYYSYFQEQSGLSFHLSPCSLLLMLSVSYTSVLPSIIGFIFSHTIVPWQLVPETK